METIRITEEGLGFWYVNVSEGYPCAIEMDGETLERWKQTMQDYDTMQMEMEELYLETNSEA